MDVSGLKEIPYTLEDMYQEIEDSDFEEDLKALLISALDEIGDQVEWFLKTIKEN